MKQKRIIIIKLSLYFFLIATSITTGCSDKGSEHYSEDKHITDNKVTQITRQDQEILISDFSETILKKSSETTSVNVSESYTNIQSQKNTSEPKKNYVKKQTEGRTTSYVSKTEATKSTTIPQTTVTVHTTVVCTSTITEKVTTKTTVTTEKQSEYITEKFELPEL